MSHLDTLMSPEIAIAPQDRRRRHPALQAGVLLAYAASGWATVIGLVVLLTSAL